MEKGYGLVFGGANVGMMKAVADGAKAAKHNASIIGVIIPEIKAKDLCYPDIELQEVDDYANRKKKMADLSVGFITLPGGFGSLDETFERLIHNKAANYKQEPENPVKLCCFYNVDGFFAGIKQQLNTCLQEKMISSIDADMYFISSSPSALIDKIQAYVPPGQAPVGWWEKQESLEKNY